MKSTLTRLIIVIATTIAIFSACVLVLRIYLEPRRNGLNMAHWLQLLKSDKTLTGSPLQIIQIKEAENPLVEVELPLAFDLMLKNDLIDKDGMYNNGKIWFQIGSGDFPTSAPERSKNGDCIFFADRQWIHPGTNQIQAHMVIDQPNNKDFPLRADGPIFNYIFTNEIKSP